MAKHVEASDQDPYGRLMSHRPFIRTFKVDALENSQDVQLHVHDYEENNPDILKYLA